MRDKPLPRTTIQAPLPYEPSQAPPCSRQTQELPKTLPKSPQRYGKTSLIVGGLLIYGFSAYAFYAYTSITQTPDSGLPVQDTDVSSRYDITAESFDSDVSFSEWFNGITRQRRLLVRKARGQVLEVSTGTGRNHNFYQLDKCKSLTFVDLSRPMTEIAREKFKEAHPKYANATFITQSALDPLPKSITRGVKEEGIYDTVVQTMGLCSNPQPTQLLMHLGKLAHPRHGKILLMEHGRSYYQWINKVLDMTAAKHADRHGCWWNRDISRYVEDSGLVVESMRRKHLGTLWIIEARPKVEPNEDKLKRRAKEAVNEDSWSWISKRFTSIFKQEDDRNGKNEPT
ncbi:MAG: hypothetical protein Q9191_008076 [Dirinaria sp. TL-2023a]